MANLPCLIRGKDLFQAAVAQLWLGKASIELVLLGVAPEGMQYAFWRQFLATAWTTRGLPLALNAFTSDGGQSA